MNVVSARISATTLKWWRMEATVVVVVRLDWDCIGYWPARAAPWRLLLCSSCPSPSTRQIRTANRASQLTRRLPSSLVADRAISPFCCKPQRSALSFHVSRLSVKMIQLASLAGLAKSLLSSLTFSLRRATSLHDSSLSMLNTKMNAFEVLIERSRIAGKLKAPLVSRMSSVSELSSGSSYSPRCSSSIVCR